MCIYKYKSELPLPYFHQFPTSSCPTCQAFPECPLREHWGCSRIIEAILAYKQHRNEWMKEGTNERTNERITVQGPVLSVLVQLQHWIVPSMESSQLIWYVQVSNKPLYTYSHTISFYSMCSKLQNKYKLKDYFTCIRIILKISNQF